MQHLTARLAGQPVTIEYPALGELDALDGPEGAGLPSGTFYGLDVESTAIEETGAFGATFSVRTVQLAPTDDRAIVLRLDDDDQVGIARAVLADPTNAFASHTKIDVHAVWVALGVDIADRYQDTHVLAVMAAPDDRAGQASLKPVADRYGMPELGEGEKALDAVFDERYRAEHPEIGRRAIKKTTLKAHGFTTCPVDNPVFATYAGLDALAVRRLAPLLVAQTRAPRHVLLTERKLSASAVRLERRGHLVDVERLEQIAADAAEVEHRAAEVVAEHTGGLKTTQNVQLQGWLAEHGVDWDDWPNTLRTPTGAPSLAKENIKKLRTYATDEPGTAVVEAMIEHASVIDRIKRTNEVRASMDPWGRTHGTLYTVGTVTSRMSSSGPNMQNFSKKDPTMRGMFVADSGRTLISCDFAQIELRVLAALSKEQAMIDTIMQGGDLHQLTADLLGITRQQAKSCIAAGQLVTTARGYVPIELVEPGEPVWDGVEWVRQEGPVFQGRRDVLSYAGLTATPDHIVYLSDGSTVCFGHAAKVGADIADGALQVGSAVSTSDRPSGHGGPAPEVPGDVLAVRGVGGQVPGQRQARGRYGVPVLDESQVHRPSAARALGQVQRDGAAVPPRDVGGRELRGPWDRVPVHQSGALHRVGTGEPAASDVPGRGHRPGGQRRALRAGEPPVGVTGAEPVEPQGQPVCVVHGAGGCPRTRLASAADGSSGLQSGARDDDSALGVGRAAGVGAGGREGVLRWSRAATYDLVNAGPRHRFVVSGLIVSNCNFLIVYGGGGRRLASQLGWTITESEGREIVRRYWSQYPAIAALNTWMKTQRSVRLISGRYVPIGDRSHAALNYLIQGSSRELLVGAWLRFEMEAVKRKLDARIWFPIHDELVLDVADEHAEEAAKLVSQCMTFSCYGVPIEADADLLIDENGVSRWMTGDLSKEIRESRLAS